MSASMRPTRWPWVFRARARLAATVDLPTPPLPLATATTWATLGSEIFCGAPPCGCMSFPRGAFGALAQGPQVFQGVNAGLVPVAPDEAVAVAADLGHGDGPQRHQVARLHQAERV